MMHSWAIPASHSSASRTRRTITSLHAACVVPGCGATTPMQPETTRGCPSWPPQRSNRLLVKLPHSPFCGARRALSAAHIGRCGRFHGMRSHASNRPSLSATGHSTSARGFLARRASRARAGAQVNLGAPLPGPLANGVAYFPYRRHVKITNVNSRSLWPSLRQYNDRQGTGE